MDTSPSNQNTKNNKDEELSLKELILKMQQFWRYLLQKWLTLLIAGIIGAVLGVTYSFIKKPIYTAELSFALEDEKGNGLNGAAGIASQFGFDLGGGGGGAFTGDNLLELMKSRSMVEKALLTSVNIKGKAQTLAELYVIFNKLNEGWKNKPELKDVHFMPGIARSTYSLQQDSILGVLYRTITKNNLSVDKTDKKLSIIRVKVISENETFSKSFTESLAKTVSDFYIDTKTRKSVQNVTILQHQTDSVRRALTAAISGVASSVDATPNSNPARMILRVPSQSRQVDVQANTTILSELVKNLEISKVSLRKETPLIQVIDRPILPLEKERFGKVKGIILGGLIAGFLTAFYLCSRKILKNILK